MGAELFTGFGPREASPRGLLVGEAQITRRRFRVFDPDEPSSLQGRVPAPGSESMLG